MLTTTQNTGSTIFLSITNGKLVRRVDLGTEGAVERTNKNGKQVAELFYTTLTGHIKDIGIKENEYGKFLLVTVQDVATEKKCILEMNFSSGYTTTFLKALPTADIHQNIELSPALIVDGDKKKSVIFLKQGGYPVKHYYTKDNPKGMPDMVKVKVKGKETWDDTDRIEWLYNKAKALFVDVPF